MGIIDMITKQFIDVIDWTESEEGVLSYRYPMQDREIQNGAQLTVRDSQLALFVNEGQIADMFKPGLHTLTTKTLPILTTIKNWDKLFQSPFKSDVYFFSTREQIAQKWGTPTAITIRDKEFGGIRIQSYGTYSYCISDPKLFYQRISGTREIYRASDLSDQLRSAIITGLGAVLGSGKESFIDMAANQRHFSELLKQPLDTEFASYGLTLKTFMVQSVSLPAELEKRLDERAGMNMVGNLNNYIQFQTAQSIPTAAANQSGLGGVGAAMGAGLGIAQAMGQAMGGIGQGGRAATGGEDPFAQIEKLHELLKKGVLTQTEFDAKKAELMKKIG